MHTLSMVAHHGRREGDQARAQGVTARDKALVYADWRRVLFLHYAIPSNLLQPHVPQPFVVEEHDGSAWITLVALTMRCFRRHPKAPWWSRMFGLILEQRFFNVRTYVRHGDQTGAYFLWGWLSRPWGLPWSTAGLGLPCAFGEIEFDHGMESGPWRGLVRSRAGRFCYRAMMNPGAAIAPCVKGSLGHFALERYNGYFHFRGSGRIFRARHAPWSAACATVEVQEQSLMETAFPWFGRARLAGAHFTPGVGGVEIERPGKLES